MRMAVSVAHAVMSVVCKMAGTPADVACIALRPLVRILLAAKLRDTATVRGCSCSCRLQCISRDSCIMLPAFQAVCELLNRISEALGTEWSRSIHAVCARPQVDCLMEHFTELLDGAGIADMYQHLDSSTLTVPRILTALPLHSEGVALSEVATSGWSWIAGLVYVQSLAGGHSVTFGTTTSGQRSTPRSTLQTKARALLTTCAPSIADRIKLTLVLSLRDLHLLPSCVHAGSAFPLPQASLF